MDDVEDQSLNTEVAPQETVQEHSETQSQGIQSEKPKEDSRQEYNWRELNRAKKDLERKLKMQEELNERLLQMTAQSSHSSKIVEKEDEDADDAFIEKGKVKKLAKSTVAPLEQKIQELEEKLNKQQQANFIQDLKRRYSDFDDVVTPETMQLLEEQEPELAATIVELKDPYKIGIQTYKYIKALNISQKATESRRGKEVDKKLEKNSKTIQTPQAYDKRPLAQAFRMTETEKKAIYEEMLGFARMAGSVPEM